MRRETITQTDGPIGVEVSIRAGVVRLYTKVDGPVFLSNCLQLPRDDFRALVETLTQSLHRLDSADATGTPS